MKKLRFAEWKEIAETKFGEDMRNWKFKCCSCGQSQTLQDFLDAKIENSEEKFFFSCIGRWVKDRGCDWTLGGLLQIHETEVINLSQNPIPAFEFAESETALNNHP